MCPGIKYVHATCKHARKFCPIQKCNTYNGITCPNLTPVHTITITAPALCVRCFRQREAAIDVEYKTTVHDLRNEIARIDEAFAIGIALVPPEMPANTLTIYRAECENNIVQAKATRDTSIRLFRQQQGVWGDG